MSAFCCADEGPEEVAKRARIAVFSILARTGTERASSQATESEPPTDPPANTVRTGVLVVEYLQQPRNMLLHVARSVTMKRCGSED